jgi:cell division initiation protein
MRGLDAEEVYAFLSTVGDEYEAVLNDNKALRERLLELDDKVQEYRTMEKTLRDTLLTAERVTVEAKDNARREANLIIKEAQIEADRSLRDIKSQAMKLRQEVSQLRSQRESYLGRMKVIAASLLKFIEGVEEDFYEEDDAYRDQLPREESFRSATAPADPQAENSDLFDRAGSKVGRAPENDTKPAETPSGPASVSISAKRPKQSDNLYRATPGIPSELRSSEVVESPGSNPVPRRGAEEPPAPASHEARNESRTDSTLSDISSIIERMADGQKEITGQSPRTQSPPVTGATRKPKQFDPVSATPAGPIATGDAADEPAQTLEATTEDPTPVGGMPNDGRPPISVASAWERVAETATAVEIADDNKEPARQYATDPKVTSELSLEQIRRDLERRMAEEKNDT